MLTDAPGWRAMLFCLASLPLAILTFTLTWTLLPLGVGGLTYWAWYFFFLPAQQAADGTWHRGAQLNEWFLDTRSSTRRSSASSWVRRAARRPCRRSPRASARCSSSWRRGGPTPRSRRRCSCPRGAVEKNVTSIFERLGLPQDSADNRRVLAVLRYLGV